MTESDSKAIESDSKVIENLTDLCTYEQAQPRQSRRRLLSSLYLYYCIQPQALIINEKALERVATSTIIRQMPDPET